MASNADELFIARNRKSKAANLAVQPRDQIVEFYREASKRMPDRTRNPTMQTEPDCLRGWIGSKELRTSDPRKSGEMLNFM
jgi:hypothetical protein